MSWSGLSTMMIWDQLCQSHWRYLVSNQSDTWDLWLHFIHLNLYIWNAKYEGKKEVSYYLAVVYLEKKPSSYTG